MLTIDGGLADVWNLGAALGAATKGKMAPNFRQATPDAALRILTATAVNRRLGPDDETQVDCRNG